MMAARKTNPPNTPKAMIAPAITRLTKLALFLKSDKKLRKWLRD